MMIVKYMRDNREVIAEISRDASVLGRNIFATIMWLTKTTLLLFVLISLVALFFLDAAAFEFMKSWGLVETQRGVRGVLTISFIAALFLWGARVLFWGAPLSTLIKGSSDTENYRTK